MTSSSDSAPWFFGVGRGRAAPATVRPAEVRVRSVMSGSNEPASDLITLSDWQLALDSLK
jgi:hypothetical protein